MFKEKLYCGVDVGSHQIKAGIIKVKDDQNIELISVSSHRSYGFKDGSVTDIGELSDCMQMTLKEVSKNAGTKLKSVHLGVDGDLISTRKTSTVIPLLDKGSKVISSRDVKKVNNNAKLLGIKMDEEVLHNIPLKYMIDDTNLALNPLGLYGRKLSVESLMIVSRANRLRNIIKAFNQVGYDIFSVSCSHFAAAEVTLNKKEKIEGSVLIDIGARQTNISIFKDGIIRDVAKINLGGDNFTRSIANSLNLTFELAEGIKKSYAVALEYDSYQDEEILVKREDNYIPIKRESIYKAIEPDILRLGDSLKEVLTNSKMFSEVNCGITMVGGGSLLPGLIERIAREINLPIKLGKIGIKSRVKAIKGVLYLSVVGLALREYNASIKNTFIFSGRKNLIKDASNLVKELYNEYF